MQIIIDAYKKTKSLHHAYLIEGDRQAVFLKLTRFLNDEIGIASIGNPDFWHGEFEKFGIDEGRRLKDFQSRRSVTGLPRIFVISTHFITREAQNTLLKVFEDPAEDTHFFFITSSAEKILPTLRSRLFIVSDDSACDRSEESIEQADAFLRGNIAERIKIIKPLIDDKDKPKVIAFLDALETVSHDKYHDDTMQTYKDLFEDTIKCRSYLYGNAPSIKMILEHLAITAPCLK